MTDEAKSIVKALRTRCSDIGDCNECPKACYCFYGGDWKIRNDAADLIEALTAELEQVKRERDAAVEDLNMCCPCEACARSCKYDKVNPYDECADFMWRGTKEE